MGDHLPFTFGFALDEINREELRKKALDPSWTNEGKMTSKEIESLGLSKKDIGIKLTQRNYSQFLKKDISFEQFSRNIGNYWTLFNDKQLENINPYAVAFYFKKQSGLKSVIEELSQTGLKIHLGDLINHGALAHDISRLQDGKMSYGEFRNKHSLEAIQQHQLANVPDYEKEAVKNIFLNSYRNMHDYSQDASLFGISDIKERMKAKYTEDLKQIHSFDQILLQMGDSVFKEKILTKENPLLADLVRKKIKEGSSYRLSASSPLMRYDLVPDGIQKWIIAAQKKDDEVVAECAEKEMKLKHTLLLAEGKYEDEFAASVRKDLDPIQAKLKSRNSELQEAISKKNESIAFLEQHKKESDERNKLRIELKNKKLEFQDVDNLYHKQGLIANEEFQALLHQQQNLVQQNQRKKAVQHLLGDIGKVAELKSEHGNLVFNIAQLDEKAERRKKVAGIGQAMAAMKEEGKNNAQKLKLTNQKKEIERRLAAIEMTKQNEQALRNELANFGDLDGTLSRISVEVNAAQEQIEIAKKRDELLKAVQLLEERLSPTKSQSPMELAVHAMKFAENTLNVDVQEKRIVELEKEVEVLKNSLLVIQTKLTTKRDTYREIAQKAYDAGLNQLKQEKVKRLQEIQSEFMSNI